MTCRHTGTVYQCVLLGAFVSRFRNALESSRINYVAVVGAGDEAPEGRWFRERKERGEAGDHSVCQAQSRRLAPRGGFLFPVLSPSS